ncbi:MAG TPA: hypothetical protein VHD91_09890, partial [Gaiellaceae bacterium]|nr:hypothetical protein [Gaiellaceae bacterium]
PQGFGGGRPRQGFAPRGGGRFAGPGGGARQGQGGLGGLLDSATPSAALVKLLQTDASSYRWVAAGVGANSVAGVELASGEPVMAIGGFNGTDPAPTLAQFEADVAAGRIHYFLASGNRGGGGFGGPGSSASTSAIQSWIEANFTAQTVGGVTVYDLTTTSRDSSQT